MKLSEPIKSKVYNRGVAPDSFLEELIAWGRTAPDEIFMPRPAPASGKDPDIYAAIKPELGPWTGLQHRKAAMLEVMRVLAGFESSWDWTEGVDTSRLGADTPANSEAGAWQVSFDSRRFGDDLRILVGPVTGAVFQRRMKFEHTLAMEYVARLMRHTHFHNGPLYRGSERNAIRKSLRGAEHSIYPWLSREAVLQFMSALA